MTTAGPVTEEDVRLDLSTREAPWRWVLVVDSSLPVGLAANATACLAASVGNAVPRLIGPAAVDGSGLRHEGLPWTGCAVLGADTEGLHRLRTRATGKPGVLVTDMPAVAQQTRVYQEYQRAVADAAHDDIVYLAVSILGPRNRVDKLVGGLRLLR
jgi:hypothetical protein